MSDAAALDAKHHQFTGGSTTQTRSLLTKQCERGSPGVSSSSQVMNTCTKPSSAALGTELFCA